MKQSINYRETRSMLDFFMEIWIEREHVSQISGEPIEEFNIMCFAHVVNKNSYPEYKFSKEAVVLMLPREHHVFDNQTDIARKDKRFDWVFEKRQELKLRSSSKNPKVIRV